MIRPRSATVKLSVGLAAALLLATVAGVGAASTTGPSGLAVPSPAQRSVQVWLPGPQPRQFGVNSVSIGAPVTDEFQITYRQGTFTLDYERAAGGPVTSSYSLTLQGLAELRTTGDGEFSADAVAAYTPLGAAAFGNRTIQHTETTVNGVLVDTFLIESNDGFIVMKLTVSQGFVPEGSGWLTPMEAELNLQINHTMTTSDTVLALQVGISTSQPLQVQNESWDDQHDFAHNEHAINVTNDSNGVVSSTFFAWSNEATVNGHVGTVSASEPVLNQTSGAYDVYFAYPRFNLTSNSNEIEVEHDPTLGVVSAAYASLPGGPLPTGPGIQADVALYAVSLVAVAALVGGTAVLASRRGRKAR